MGFPVFGKLRIGEKVYRISGPLAGVALLLHIYKAWVMAIEKAIQIMVKEVLNVSVKMIMSCTSK